MKRVFFGCAFICFFSNLLSQDFQISTASGIDLLRYETFTVLKGSIIANSDQPIDKEAFYARIKPSLIRELETRGYVYTSDSTADLSISYVVETTVRLDVQQQGRIAQQIVVTNPNPIGGNQSQALGNEITQGVLIIEIEETKRKTAIWSAEGIMDVNRTRGGDLVDNAVRSAFRKFPDKTKKTKTAKKPKN